MMNHPASCACGRALLGALTLMCLTATVLAHPFQVEDMQNLSRVGEVRISTDGQWAVFTVTRSDLAKNRSATMNLWRVSTAGGEPEQLTFVDHGSNYYATLVFRRPLSLASSGSRVDAKPQVFRLSVAGGDAMQVTSFATGVADFVLSPDGNTLAIVASVFPSCTDMACNAKRLKDHTDDPVKVRVITEIPFRRWDSWVDGQRNHIFIMPAAGGIS